MLRSTLRSVVKKVESVTHPLSSHTFFKSGWRFDATVFLSNLRPLSYGAVSRFLGIEDQHLQSLHIVIGATNMQRGLVKLCFTLRKLMCVSVNHKPCLKALYKRTSPRRANFSTVSLETQRTRKQKAQDKKNIVNGV